MPHLHRDVRQQGVCPSLLELSQLQPATDEQRDRLNEAPILALRTSDLSKLTLTVPEFLSDEFGFAYSNKPLRDNRIYANLDIDQQGQELSLADITIDRLQKRWIYP